MDVDAQIEWMLEQTLAASESPDAPPKLAAALRNAVFPGGARVRPKLCLAVANACAEGRDLTPALAAASAIELLHCASLVHDDLPCFDDADLRRGKPTIHVTFGEPLAVLTGDALIAMTFQVLARHGRDRVADLVMVLGEAAAPPYGIAAGQAWESERLVNLSAYHRSKTGALFTAATRAGAAAVDADPAPWTALGDKLGEAYQIADDLRDALLSEAELGKPRGQDVVHSRPNAVETLGIEAAYDRLSAMIQSAADSVPDCDGADSLRDLVFAQARRLTPNALAQRVA